MKILLVSYFYKPNHSVAAIRWSRMVEALEEKGHDIEVISGPWSTSDEKTLYIEDNASLDAKSKTEKRTSIIHFVKNLFPRFLLMDGKFFWSLKAANILRKKIKQSKPDLVLVTGTPWSTVYLISRLCFRLKQKYGIDFRDLWAAEPTHHHSSKLAKLYFRNLESKAVQAASFIIAVNQVLCGYFEKKYPSVKCFVVGSGFKGKLNWDKEKFNSNKDKNYAFLYAGSISPYHGVENFLEAFKDQNLLTFMINNHSDLLDKNRVIAEKSPDEAELEMTRASVLVLMLRADARHITSGKLISYIKAGRPILYYGPIDSPAAGIIKENHLGWVISNGDYESLRSIVSKINEKIKNEENFDFNPDIAALQNYSIDTISAKLDEYLRKI